MARRPCIQCGTPAKSTRCPRCEAQRQQQRNAKRTHYHGDWDKRSATTRQAWIAEHGMTCAGYHRPPHPAQSLHLDHTTGLVLCPRCNVNAGPAGPTSAIPYT